MTGSAICHDASRWRGLLAVALALVGMLGVAGLDTDSAYAFHYIALTQFGSPGSQAGQLAEPDGVAVDQSTGDVYVADRGNRRVDEFDAEGNFVSAWGWGVSDGQNQSEVCTLVCLEGLPGSGPGQLSRPSAIAVDNSNDASQGDVYVADEATDVITKFDPNGNYLSTLYAGAVGPFGALYGVAVDGSGDVWAYDESAEVYELRENGTEIQRWNTSYGVGRGFAVDGHLDVYAARGCGCTEKFSSAGKDLGQLDPANTKATGLATDHIANSVFDDQEKFVAKYSGEAELPASPLAVFGQGILQKGGGLDVDSGSGRVYVADEAADDIDVFGPPIPGPPMIERALVANVDAVSAELKAALYTGQTDTSYYFEYGTTLAYGSQAPAVSANIGAGIETVNVSQSLAGLSPGTLYHFRVVAENSHETAMSGDHTFITASNASPSGLPDARQYELVSPPDKNGGDVGALGRLEAQAASDGEAITYSSMTSFSSSQSAELINQYLSTRTPAGWITAGLSPPVGTISSVTFSSPFDAFTNDLSAAVLTWTNPPLTPGASAGYANLYVLDTDDNSYHLVTVTAPHNGSEAHFVGASADFSHVVFQIDDALTPEGAPEAQNVYEWTEGHLTLISVPPGATMGAAGSGAGDNEGDTQGAVSTDGSVVFWTDAATQLYAWEAGRGSLKVNASQRSPSLGDGQAVFLGASPDGSDVIFSDETPLTQGADDNGGLYELDLASGKLLDLTPSDSEPPGVLGVLGYANDGSSVYFVATAKLAGGASAGQNNLYVTHNGALTYIATLASGDGGDWVHEPVGRNAAVSPDGTHAVFMSEASLTGYENIDAITGKPDSEVYEYDAEDAQLNCVSCNPSGEAPQGSSSVPTWLNDYHNPHYLSDDGNRVFFDSFDALTPRDTNGREDVYEWERGGACERSEGCVYLISSGSDPSNSLFADASLSGDDVFFATHARLVPQDVDENLDLYDARVGGGFAPATPLAPCAEESCLGPPTAPPSLVGPLPSTMQPPAQAPKPDALFTLGALGTKAADTVVHDGRLVLPVHVSQAGTLVAEVTMSVHHRTERIATSSLRSHGAGEVTFVLKLAKQAQLRLASSHTLRVTVTVSFSASPQPKHVLVTLREGGNGR